MAFFKFGKTNTEKQLTDEEIVALILSGEQQHLDVLYDRYSAKIFHKCLSIIKDREASKDCTHDIMVKIFMNLAKFQGRSAFSLWVHSITYNFCMDYLSKQKRRGISDKLLLLMRYQDGMSVRDISESLGVGESAIKMRLKRSRDRLGDLIEDLQKKQG
jgi:DNA-directed RNA polymerase specialized sigma24 family protein